MSTSELKVEAVGISHVGRRKNNEDRLCIEPSLGLYAVADGMGGYEGGEVASRLTVDELSGFVARNRRDPGGTWPCKEDKKRSFQENLLSAGVMVAHQAIVAGRVGVLDQMGSTVVAVLVEAGRLTFAHVGDSRLYRLRDGKLEQLTRDHSVWAEMEAHGMAGARENFPYRNQITRALGTNVARPDVATLELQRGDTFLLCSDGLYDPLEAARLGELLSKPLGEASEALVQAAYDAGGTDNITAVLLRAEGR
jgi:serine/threonine protein phosphatase PrpC